MTCTLFIVLSSVAINVCSISHIYKVKTSRCSYTVVSNSGKKVCIPGHDARDFKKKFRKVIGVDLE